MKVSRDKRGYEHIYLMEAIGRGRSSKPRVLYWFRTPPGVSVGREPFDESICRALEARYPEVTFDWDKLRKTAIPPADAEPWRERRRTERTARQARQSVERDRAEAVSSGTVGQGMAPTEVPPAEDAGNSLASEDLNAVLAEGNAPAVGVRYN